MTNNLWNGFTFLGQLLCTVALGIGTMSIIGYAYGAQNLYRWTDNSAPMAVPTAIALTANALATFIVFEVVKRRSCTKRDGHHT